jgi:hypothetical protein
MRKVVLLASYCGDNSNCTDKKPCLECLAMCNTFNIEDSAIDTENYVDTLSYLNRESGNYSRKQVRILLKEQIQAVSNSVGRMPVNMVLVKGMHPKEYADECMAVAKRIKKVRNY